MRSGTAPPPLNVHGDPARRRRRRRQRRRNQLCTGCRSDLPSLIGSRFLSVACVCCGAIMFSASCLKPLRHSAKPPCRQQAISNDKEKPAEQCLLPALGRDTPHGHASQFPHFMFSCVFCGQFFRPLLGLPLPRTLLLPLPLLPLQPFFLRRPAGLALPPYLRLNHRRGNQVPQFLQARPPVRLLGSL